jgi:DNA-binding HxlR family transcriptional regulator
MKIREQYTCPLELAQDLIKGKWKPIILWNLQQQRTLAELQRSIVGINQKMLIQQMHELIDFGLVNRHKHPGYPLRTDLSLSERGLKMIKAIEILQSIGAEIQGSID